MPPVNTNTSAPDVDHEATAELPVLDVAAYESTLDDVAGHSDTWVLPAGLKVEGEAIPTLRMAVDLESTADISVADFSGTHEMPAYPQLKNPLKSPARAPATRPAAAKAKTAVPVTAPAPAPKAEPAPREVAVNAAPAPVAVPPSPPLIGELRGALATAERRIEELQERARIADAERAAAVARANAEAAQLRRQLESHLEALHSAQEQLGVRHAEESALQDELFARADRIATLQSDLDLQDKVLNEKVAALAVALGRAETLETDAMNLRASVTRRDRQIAVLEADLAARQQRESTLKARLEDATVSINANVPALRAELAVRDEQVRKLERALKDLQTCVEDRNHDLQVAEESIRNLENEVRDKTGKLEEANVTVEEWRAVIAESQRSILERDNRIRELQADLEKRIAVGADRTAQTSEEVALEGPARVLIRTDGNTDFVHVLGRRTRIGRGSDNELVLDTKHISRYHAVLLAGPVHTSIEDLQSTNGVFVNGKRVTRQVLKDGDRLTVGRTQFRYSVRD